MAGFLTWLRSTLHGEVSAADLGARRGAGTAAYSLAEEAAATEGDDRGTRLFRACAWNAFALQTIAEQLIDADADDDPGTAGYVPPSTLRFASDCLDGVPEWIRLARLVQSDATVRIRGLPARLPAWRTGETTRISELHALRAAYEALEARVESDFRSLDSRSPKGSPALAQARQTRSDMQSAAEYANAISRPHIGAGDRGEARWRILSALESAFELGQLLALPTLGEIARRRAHSSESSLVESASWLGIQPGWPVLDSDGICVGFVQRVHGDRDTGAFDGVEIASNLMTATFAVPAASVSAIEAGEIRLSVSRAEVATANS
jgi:hypothetical protein